MSPFRPARSASPNSGSGTSTTRPKNGARRRGHRLRPRGALAAGRARQARDVARPAARSRAAVRAGDAAEGEGARVTRSARTRWRTSTRPWTASFAERAAGHRANSTPCCAPPAGRYRGARPEPLTGAAMRCSATRRRHASVLSQHEARLDTLARRRKRSPARVRGAIAWRRARPTARWPSSAAATSRPTAFRPTIARVHATLHRHRIRPRAQPDSARKYLTHTSRRWQAPGTISTALLGPTLFRLGELYENAGDTKRATEYYGRFVDLWKNADAELQPRVAEAPGSASTT